MIFRNLGKLRKFPMNFKDRRLSQVFGNPGKCLGDLRKSLEVFGQSSEILKWSLEIFGDVCVIFGNLRKCSGDLWKSLELFRWSSESFESVWGIFGKLRECSGDLWKSLEGFVWPSIIFRRFNRLISLAESNCPIFSQIGQFLHFYSKTLLKTVQIKPQMGQFLEIKGE